MHLLLHSRVILGRNGARNRWNTLIKKTKDWHGENWITTYFMLSFPKHLTFCSRIYAWKKTPGNLFGKKMEFWHTWSDLQKMWASSCWNRRTRVRPDSAPESSLRCRTPKSANRIGSSFQERGRWSNIKLWKGTLHTQFYKWFIHWFTFTGLISHLQGLRTF